MDSWWTYIQGFWQGLGQAAAAPTTQWIIAAALVLLVTFYLLLTRTRLARMHIVWKCIILSVAAHAMLVLLAFGTRLVFEYGLEPGGEPLVIRLIDDLDAGLSDGDLHRAPPFTEPPDANQPRERLATEWLAQQPNEVHSLSPMPTDEFASASLFEAAPPLLSPPAERLDAHQPATESAGVPSLASLPPDELPQEFESSADADEEAAAVVTAGPSELVAETPPVPVDEAASPAGLDDPRVPQPVQGEPCPMALPNEQVALQPVQFRRPEARRSGDANPLPSHYILRAPENRRRAALQRGGSDATESAVELALKWLSARQESDGRWSVSGTGGGVDRRDLGHERPGCGRQADTGITGLALLAFLGAGHSHLEGDYQAIVAKGLNYLIRVQSADGCLGGDAQLYDRMYCHGIALLALADALAFTGDHRLRQAVELGVNYTVRSQSTTDGGWRYRPGDSGDMSQFGWQVMALHCAQLAGVPIPERTTTGMHRFLSRSTRGTHGGLGCYRPGEGHTPSMTAEALVSRFFLESTVASGTIDEAAQYLRRFLPSTGEVNYYYWYYGTMAMHMAGGEHWRQWNDAVVTSLLSRQIITGPDAGCWPADGLWSGYGGPVFSTALATLCLECYYRWDLNPTLDQAIAAPNH